MKFYIKTFGCRVNIAESDELADRLEKKHELVPISQAEVVIVRSCSVTGRAESDVKQAVRSYKRQGKTVYVLGCFLEKILETDSYFTNDAALIRHINQHFESVPNIGETTRDYRLRSFIKIQTGCDFECSFCVTRLIRGKSKSVPPAKIIQTIKGKEALGIKEIVLTGINILLYKNIVGLIQKILKETSIPRIRFGSIDPRLVNDKFINLFEDDRLMPHLHFSIQSGSEKILEKMSRPVKIKKIENIVSKLRNIDPLFNISADIIVGFPGEENSDFQKTIALAKKLKLSKIHYFPYSSRPRTPAAALLPIKSIIMKKRLDEIKKLDITLQNAAKNKILGKTLTVFFECGKNHVYYGYAPNFVRIKSRSKNYLTGEIKKIIIKKNNIINV